MNTSNRKDSSQLAARGRKLAKSPQNPRNPNNLEIVRDERFTHERQFAQMEVSGLAGNATAVKYLARDFNELLHVTELYESLLSAGEQINRNDFSGLEAMLTAQAVTTNTLFVELTKRAATNIGHHLPATDTYLRLAMKAQAQCRTTVQTLFEMKNPRAVAVFGQANINQGGQQQVNNGTPVHPVPEAKSENQQPELLEAHSGEWLDTGAKGSTGPVDQALAAVGTIDRAQVRGRKGSLVAERMERRDETGSSRTRQTAQAATKEALKKAGGRHA